MLAKLDLPDRQTLLTWHGEPAPDPETAASRRFLGIGVVPLGWLASRLARPMASGVIVVGSAGVIAVAVGAGIAILDNPDDVNAPGDTVNELAVDESEADASGAGAARSTTELNAGSADPPTMASLLVRYAQLTHQELRSAILGAVEGTNAASYVSETQLGGFSRPSLVAALHAVETAESLDDGLAIWNEISTGTAAGANAELTNLLDASADLSTPQLREAILRALEGTGAAATIDEDRLRQFDRTFLVTALQTVEQAESLDSGSQLWRRILATHERLTLRLNTIFRSHHGTVSLMSVLGGHCFQVTEFYDDAGSWHLVGEIFNDQNGNAYEAVVILVKLFDDAGTALGEVSTTLAVDTLLPYTAAPFHLIVEDPPAGYTRYDMDVTARIASQPGGRRNIDIIDSEQVQDASGAVRITGVVRNEGTRAYTEVRLVATVYDANGVVVGVDEGLVSIVMIEPGESAAFEVMVDETAGDADRHALMVRAS